MLNAERLDANLPLHGLGKPFHLYQQVMSTNDVAIEMAKHFSPHGTLIVADWQTAGRGRAGREWLTPPGSALAISIILRPKNFLADRIGELTALGALAVVEQIEKLGAVALIKWPNDVLVKGRKVAGVLVEGSWVGKELDFAVLGIGVNVHQASIPRANQIDFPATCVDVEVGTYTDREQLLLGLVEGVGKWLPTLGDDRFLSRWNQNLAFQNQEVIVEQPTGEMIGKVLGIAAGGSLRIEREDGEVQNLDFGDVRLRPVDIHMK
jgi:BirA family biotin operon repressor/biotin-[acetyl-CoA-carboxylase] ligase